ncbi:glutamate receptor U1-like [Panulirus ornatus]|uniref:glutamate receptor U1-like n=1 Tax=Panulirus ornatus TaxID=150431 RepID=UPI003A86C68A
MVRSLQELLSNASVVSDMVHNPKTFRFRDGASLVAAVVDWPPHVILKGDTSAGGASSTGGRRHLSIRGPMANLLTVLTQKLNFTYTLVEPDDRAWGTKLPNGSWTGMLGLVSRQEVDIALGPFGHTESRTEVADFTRSFFFDDRSILARKGVPEIDPWSFVFSLAPMVWLVLLGALLAVWAAMWLLTYEPRASGHRLQVGAILFHHLRVLLHQGECKVLCNVSVVASADMTWTAVTGREMVVVGGWSLTGMVVTWSYCSNLMSLLAVRHVAQPLHTVRALLDDASITVILEPGTVLTDVLENSKSGELRELGELRQVGRLRYQVATTFPEALDTLVRRGDHVLVSTSLFADLLISHLSSRVLPSSRRRKTTDNLVCRCDFYKARQTFVTSTYCMIGQKGSPLVPVMSHRIRALVESGLYNHWLASSIPESSSCRHAPSKITVKEPLAIHSVWGMFVVLGAGLQVATLVFILEIILGRYLHLRLEDTP